VGTLGLLKKMAHIYFHQIIIIIWHFNLCNDMWQKWGCRKRQPKFIEMSFNFINQKPCGRIGVVKKQCPKFFKEILKP
jgi:hypothetical protein